MTELIIKKESKLFSNHSEEGVLNVSITPCVEGHSMTYCENFFGTLEEILSRSIEILEGLKHLFPKGDFSIQIEDKECTQIRFIHSGFVFDNEGNIVGCINDYILDKK